MNIGIIVYSQTENCYTVALKIQEDLKAQEHQTEVERVTIQGEVNPGSKEIILDNIPQLDKFDAIIFGAPVHAFNLAKPMKAYMEQLPSLENKKIACFVTKSLPFNWTGGNHAISSMKKICQSKGGQVLGTDIIIWNKKRDQKISEVAHSFSLLF